MKGCVVILKQYELQQSDDGMVQRLDLESHRKPGSGFSLLVQRMDYIGAEGCYTFDNPVDVMRDAAIVRHFRQLRWSLECTVPIHPS